MRLRRIEPRCAGSMLQVDSKQRYTMGMKSRESTASYAERIIKTANRSSKDFLRRQQ